MNSFSEKLKIQIALQFKGFDVGKSISETASLIDFSLLKEEEKKKFDVDVKNYEPKDVFD